MILFSRNRAFCGFYDMLCIQAIFFQQLCWRSAFPEAVVHCTRTLVEPVCFLPGTCATLSPRPPIRLCSSAVTTQPVFPTDFIRIASSSEGLDGVDIDDLGINALPASRISPAWIASQTMWPVAMMLTSVPSFTIQAFPISNFWSGSVNIGITGRPETQVNRSFVISDRNSSRFGLVVIARVDDGHARKHFHHTDIFQDLVGSTVSPKVSTCVRSTDFDIFIRICNTLTDLIINTARREVGESSCERICLDCQNRPKHQSYSPRKYRIG